MAIPTVIVNYDGTDYGRVYLQDVGQRNQLGGGKGINTLGQDRYLSHGQDATFVGTGDVMMSRNYAGADRTGQIKNMEDRGAFTVTDTF
jgi:transketolase C-terminal domain/subunit